MKKNFLLILFSFCCFAFSVAQNVGIGTNTPHSSAQLDIQSITKGLLIPRLSTAQRNAIATPAEGLMVYDTDVKSFFVYNGTVWRDVAGSGSSKWTLIGTDIINNNSGNVGIGVLNPAFTLSLNGSIGMYIGTQLQSTIQLQSSDSNLLITAKRGSSIGNIPAKDIILQRSSGTSTGGNVSIDVDDPFYRLSVQRSIGLYNGVSITGSMENLNGDFLINARPGLLTPATNLILQYSSSGLGGPGKVGISTNSPQAKLHVSGFGEIIRASNGNAATQIFENGFQFLNSSGTGRYYMLMTGNDFTISNSSGNNTGKLILNGNQVTIGQITPANGYLLSIGGKAICEELKVQLRGLWADYVFNKDYQLKSFEELRLFIAKNKHLPNIPAAAEIEKNGLDVGDMQRRLTEKIEELTLYILQLEERLKKLETNHNK